MGGSEQMNKQLGSQVPVIGESFEARKEAFVKEVNTIGDKYNIALRAQLVYTREGIIPQYVYLDVKKKENGESNPKDHLSKKE